MQAIIERDHRALDRFHARYRVLIGKIMTEILPNEADMEEAMQDVFVEVWSRAANFDASKGKPLGWLICIARRRAIDHYRKIRRRVDHSEKLLQASAAGDGHDIPGMEAQVPAHRVGSQDAAATNDLRAHLMRIIGTLPKAQERVIHQTFFENMSQREIAAQTGIPLGTIKTRLDLALRKLTSKSELLRWELHHMN